MTSSHTPALWHLLGVYFNQDWPEDYGDESRALDAFVAESDELVDQLPGEVAWVLDTCRDEAAISAYLDSLGCQYQPIDGSYRDWLTRIADHVRAATAAG